MRIRQATWHRLGWVYVPRIARVVASAEQAGDGDVSLQQVVKAVESVGRCRLTVGE